MVVLHKLGFWSLVVTVLSVAHRPTTAQDIAPGAVDERIVAALQRFDRSLEGVLPWLASLYDPASGGFFDSAASRDMAQYGPDIQSTAQAMDIASIAGVSEQQMPPELRRRFIEYFQSRQDRATGYFIDPHYREQMRGNQRVLGRALSYATARLSRLGAKPLHPLPGAGATEGRPGHLRSLDNWRRWLESQVGDNPGWTELDRLQSQGAALRSLPDDEREAYVDMAIAFITERQNEQTGLWAGELDGAFKAVLFIRGMNRPVPRADAILESAMHWIRRRPTVEQTSRVGNPARLLSMLRDDLTAPITEAQLNEVIDWYLWVMRPFRREDGGFSRYTSQFFIRPNDIHMEQVQQPQSDVNGTTMLMRARASLYGMAGYDPEKLPPLPGAETFYQGLLRVPAAPRTPQR
jgi:hypothetical protein